MPAVEIGALEDGLWVLDKVAQVGRLNASRLAETPGWNRLKAWRYLEVLARASYLEKIGSGHKIEYILGRKFLDRGDMSFGAKGGL